MDAAFLRSLLAQPCHLCECPTADGGVRNPYLFPLWNNAHHNHTICDTCQYCILNNFSEEVNEPYFKGAAVNNNNQKEKLIHPDVQPADTTTSSASKQEEKTGQKQVDYSSSSEDSVDSYKSLVIDEGDDDPFHPENSASNIAPINLDRPLQVDNPESKKCIYCLMSLSNTSGLRHHILRKHNDVSIKCELSQRCPTYFKTKKEREKHYQNQHRGAGKSYVECCLCKKNYSKNSFQSHLKLLHSQHKIVRCSYFRCATYFKTEEDQHHHVKSVHENLDEKFRCIYCGKFYAAQLGQHVMSKHPDVAIRCNFSAKCPTFFKTEEERQQHVQKEHRSARAQKVAKKPVG